MKTFTDLRSEVKTAARLTKKEEGEVIREVIEWIDYQFHGVVPFDFEASKPEGRGLEE